MRTTFIETLCELAARDPRVWLITGDLGFSVLEKYAQRFPDRFINAGVAEQNMTGMAAGLALSGNVVFTYSIANFPTLRCLEQIRNDVCYHRANVKIVAVGGGFTYGANGYTHHGLEDLAILGSLPEMTVVAPGDPWETRLAVEAIVQREGPCYLRLGKAGEPAVHTSRPPFEIGRAIQLRDGRDVTLISTGGMLKRAVDARDALLAQGIRARVLSMHTIKPLDEAAVLQAARETGAIITLEEHNLRGGLGSAVADVLASAGVGIPFAKIAAPDCFWHMAGSQAYFQAMTGDPVELAKRLLSERSQPHKTPAPAKQAEAATAAKRKLISVVTPCYNEEANVRVCRDAVRRIFQAELPGYDYEHIFCDNASKDGTVGVLREMAAEDERVKVILNSRNFGPFRSMFNGIRSTSGDAVLCFLPADLQDPPEMIPKMVHRWEEGYEVVCGIRAKREEDFIMRNIRRLYYRLVSRLADIEIPMNVGEFQVVDRCVIESLRNFEDYYPYVRGMIASCGFKSTSIPYTWKRRERGMSKNRLYHLIDQGLNGLVSFTNVPLRLCTFFGLSVSGLAFFYGIATLVLNLVYYRAWAAPGIPTLIVAIFFFSGIQLFFLGFLGEYVGAIHSQVRKRPMVIERERLNFDRQRPDSTTGDIDPG